MLSFSSRLGSVDCGLGHWPDMAWTTTFGLSFLVEASEPHRFGWLVSNINLELDCSGPAREPVVHDSQAEYSMWFGTNWAGWNSEVCSRRGREPEPLCLKEYLVKT